MKIGVAGCGRMGEPMLDALCAAGFDGHGLDVENKKHDRITTDPALFSQNLHTLITVVRDIAQTDTVLFDTLRVQDHPTLRRILISSTLSPRYVRALRDRIPAAITLIDAPMSGAQVAARAARLSFMLGGRVAELDDAQPMLEAMGAHFHRMGPFGAGMQAKVLNNLLAASNTAMTRLVLDWARQADLEPDKLLALIHTSSGQNWFASGFEEIEFARDGYAEDNSIGILVKDVASALDAAPPRADRSLPETVQAAIARLHPLGDPG